MLCLVAPFCATLQPHGLYGACQTPLSIGFSRQEYWSVLPFPSLGDLGRFLPAELPGKPNAGDPGSIPWSRRSPGEGNGNLLLYFCLGNPMNR